MDKLEIQCLGTLNIKLNDQPIQDYMSGKAIGLLCYLVLNSDKVFSREKLVELFWGNSDYDAAKYNLRYSLWTLRKIFKNNDAEDVIVNVKNGCKVNEAYEVITDIHQLNKMLSNVENDWKHYETLTLDDIHSIYQGEFFEGFYLKNCPEFNDWLFYQREKSQRDYFALLSRLADYLKEKKMVDKCIQIYEEMININPLQEEWYIKLIQLYLELGDRKSALDKYERCCKVLREELDVGPMQELQKIYTQIKNDTNEKYTVGTGKNLPHDMCKVSSVNEFQLCIQNEKNNQRNIVICNLERDFSLINYGWMVHVMDTILEQVNSEIIKQRVPKHFMDDLAYLNLDLYDKGLVDEIKHKQIQAIPDIRLYKAMEKFIIHVAEYKRVAIGIRDLEELDEKSYLWLSFLVSKKKNTNVQIYILDTKNEKIKRFKK